MKTTFGCCWNGFHEVDYLEGSDKIKLTKESSPDGQHHHFIPLSWVDHVDQHVHLNKSGSEGDVALAARRTALTEQCERTPPTFRI
jgi:hypothetical protein